MKKVFIVAAKRSPIGSFGGTLRSLKASDLGGQVVKAVMAQANLSAAQVDELILGNVLGADQGMNIARQIALTAELPYSVPAYCVNMVCGSGMKSIMDGASHIKSGDADVVIAGGIELMSAVPFTVSGEMRFGHRMGQSPLNDLLISDGLTDGLDHYHMGMTAENIVSDLNISREEQDEFALFSQKKAAQAIADDQFKEEIVPISVKNRKEAFMFNTDEHLKPNTTLESLSKLKPAFLKDDGSVTAGNSSGINDGASFVILASEEKVREYQLQPIAELISYAQSGVAPRVMGLGPVPAMKKALERATLKLHDVDLIELNEAFAAQSLGVIKQLSAAHHQTITEIKDKCNIHGGAIALGHPLGASGNRILVSLLYELKHRKKQYGIAALCVGGGMGTAMLVRSTV